MGNMPECPKIWTKPDPAYKQMPRLPQEKRRPGAGQKEMRRLPAVEGLERKDRQGHPKDKNDRLQVLQILQQRRKPEQWNVL